MTYNQQSNLFVGALLFQNTLFTFVVIFAKWWKEGSENPHQTASEQNMTTLGECETSHVAPLAPKGCQHQGTLSYRLRFDKMDRINKLISRARLNIGAS